MRTRFWAPMPLESESLTLLATLPTDRPIEADEVADRVEAKLDDLLASDRSKGMKPEIAARSLLDLDSNRLTGSQILQSNQGQAFLLSLNYQTSDLQELPEEQREAMDNLSLLTVLEALAMLQ